MNTRLVQSDLSALEKPWAATPLRLPSFPCKRTAALKFRSEYIAPVNNGSADVRIILNRSPVGPLWMDAPGHYTGTVAYKGQIQFATFNGRCDIGGQIAEYWTGARTGSVTEPAATVVDTTPTVLGSDGVPILGVDHSLGSDRPFIYVPPGGFAAFVFQNTATFSTASVTGRICYERWTSPGNAVEAWSTEVTSGTSLNSWGFTLPATGEEGGFIRPKYFANIENVQTDTVATLTVTVSTGSLVYSAGVTTNPATVTVTAAPAATHFMMPKSWCLGLETTRDHFEDSRITAQGIRVENITKVMNKEGSVWAGYHNTDSAYPWTAGMNKYQSLNPHLRSRTQLANDWTLYYPPDTTVSPFLDHYLDWREYSSPTASYGNVTQVVPAMRLDDLSNYVMIILSDPDGGTQLTIQHDYHIEFASSSILFDLAMCSTTMEKYHQAALKAMSKPLLGSKPGRVMATTKNKSGQQGKGQASAPKPKAKKTDNKKQKPKKEKVKKGPAPAKTNYGSGMQG